MISVPQALEQAHQCQQAGNLEQAEELCRHILRVDPQHAGALQLLVGCCRQAMQRAPNSAEIHFKLGHALHLQGELAQAAESFRRTLELQPNSPTAWYNLGIVLKEQGQLEEAAASYRQAVSLQPSYAQAWTNLGNILADQRKLAEAVRCHEEALRLEPNHVGANNNLGSVLKQQGRLDEAIAAFQRALHLSPELAGVHLNLGNIFREQGKLDQALICYREVLRLEPGWHAVRMLLVHLLQHLGLWQDVMELSGHALTGLEEGGGPEPCAPFALFSTPLPTTAAQQLLCARLWSRQLSQGRVPMVHALRAAPAGGAAGKIKIGYLSADLHEHATAYLIAELIEKHCRDRFTICGYSLGADDDSAMRRRLVRAFDRFVDLKDATFEEAARQIAADGVDILVDLKGYTTHARTEILAFRPAPLQVNYLGFPGTMGAEFMDYILVDEFIVPPDQQQFFTEKVVYLPGCYQVNDSRREIAGPTSRSACGLPETGFVFCCFNQTYKITAELFAVWMDLLKAVPGSVLWLWGSNNDAPANLRREAAARGVAAERLVFAPFLPLPQHLARYRLADLFLDTFPVCAHTTASDALWVGCPVLTLTGQTFVSRVAGSLLHALGLPELIATSALDYRAMALRLAREPDLLANLRRRLAANRSKARLFDAERFAHGLEKAYSVMWQRYLSGAAPHAFAVHDQPALKEPEIMVEQAREPRRLHLGCGRTILPGWVNLDVMPGAGIDVVADLDRCAEAPLPFEADTFDEFLASHLFEHLRQPLPFMQELHRIARAGAVATLRVPYGSSDDAYEDPTHVRLCFLQTFGYFSQPYYWRADYGYRGDWQPKLIRLLVSEHRYQGKSAAEILRDVHQLRNVVLEMIVELVAVKPIRAPLRELQVQPKVELVLTHV